MKEAINSNKDKKFEEKKVAFQFHILNKILWGHTNFFHTPSNYNFSQCVCLLCNSRITNFGTETS